MTIFKDIYTTSNNIQTFTSTNIPTPNREVGSFLSLTDAAAGSQIDVLKHLGRPCKRVLVTFNDNGTGTNTATVKINNMSRVIVKQAERADNTLRTWDSGNYVSLSVAQTGDGTWNSGEQLGNLVIHSFELDALNFPSGGTVDLIFVP
jgi:hypothetical protein